MHELFSFILVYLLNSVSSQRYASFKQADPSMKDICTGPSNTSLVEQFFNLIFTELRNHPPECVCVQMCLDQPTYCYPNGCFKKSDSPSKKFKEARPPEAYQRTAQVSEPRKDKTKRMSYLADGEDTFLDNLINSKLIEAKQTSRYNQGFSYKSIHKDPFTDRYQTIFKNRKTPKVHLRYNLREKVRNKKGDLIRIDKIDVAKTKWPVYNSKRYHVKKSKTERINFYDSGTLNSHYPSRFFKRDTRLIKQKKTSDLEKLENETDNTELNLENVIENVIETGFGPFTKNNELDLSFSVDYNIENNATTVEPITVPYKINHYLNFIMNNNKVVALNETSDVSVLNDSNQNTNKNRYSNDSQNEQMYKDDFNEKIANLAKKIEINNKNSKEVMEYALGNQIQEIYSHIKKTETTLGPSIEEFTLTETTSAVLNADNATWKTTIPIPEQTQMTKATTTQKEIEREQISVTRKSQRKLQRKLQNNKPNKLVRII